MKLLVLALFLLYPKFDIALSSWGLYSTFNNKADATNAKALKTYLNKSLLVRGWYGGRTYTPGLDNVLGNAVILEIAPDTEHEGPDFVVAEMNDLTEIIKSHKKWDDSITVLCNGNGFREIAIRNNKPVCQPLLNDCELIK